MSIWLRDLATVLRGAGLRVSELNGWTTRANNTGALRANLGLCVHHTASGTGWTGEREANACATGSSSSPIYNVLLDRTGLFWVMAAGSTNSEGRGGPWTGSRGTVPVDGANSRMLSLSVANNGVGEPYSPTVQDALIRACAAFSRAYGYNPSRDIIFHWARRDGDNGWTTRKIDLAGPAPWMIQGDAWMRWDITRFRASVQAAMGGTTPPPIPPPTQPGDEPVTEEEMNQIAQRVWERWIDNPLTGGPIPARDAMSSTFVSQRRYIRCKTPSNPDFVGSAVYELTQGPEGGTLRHVTRAEWLTINQVDPRATVVDIEDDTNLLLLPGYGQLRS